MEDMHFVSTIEESDGHPHLLESWAALMINYFVTIS